MKIRTSFVSNSSSTSFAIIRDEDKPLEVAIRTTLEPSKTISTMEEFKRHLREEWCLGPDFDLEHGNTTVCRLYKQGKEAIEKGKFIQFFDIGNDSGNPVEEALYYTNDLKSCLPEDAQIILEP